MVLTVGWNNYKTVKMKSLLLIAFFSLYVCLLYRDYLRNLNITADDGLAICQYCHGILMMVKEIYDNGVREEDISGSFEILESFGMCIAASLTDFANDERSNID